jgi:DNA end-binding protein Ku
MWRGAISFGMVAIPVRMYLANESKGVSFRLLCPRDGAPLRNKRWCPVEDCEVGWNDAVRGYEVAKDEYVRVEDEELESLPLSTTHTIEILEFCDDSEIDAGVYVKGAYYLEPEPVGVKPYQLLRLALEKTGKVAVGKVAMRDREQLCRLALHERALLLNTLHWPDEIRDAAELALPEAGTEVHARELEMAEMLIDNLAAHFDPARYRDEYRDAVVHLVEDKLNNRPPERAPAPAAAQITDLMAALRASVEAASRQRQAAEVEEEPPGRAAAAGRRRRAS